MKSTSTSAIRTKIGDVRPRGVARGVGIALFIVAVGLLAVVVFPQAIGASESYVVLSGSMQPTMNPGDVVIARDTPAESVVAGDVIVFENGDTDSERTTHRVVNVVHREDGLHFETKGDANEQPDSQLVPAGDVTGKAWFHLPYLGHLLLFARSKIGILTLVVVPSALLVVTEVYSLSRAAFGTHSEQGADDTQDDTPDGNTDMQDGDANAEHREAESNGHEETESHGAANDPNLNPTGGDR